MESLFSTDSTLSRTVQSPSPCPYCTAKTETGSFCVLSGCCRTAMIMLARTIMGVLSNPVSSMKVAVSGVVIKSIGAAGHGRPASLGKLLCCVWLHVHAGAFELVRWSLVKRLLVIWTNPHARPESLFHHWLATFRAVMFTHKILSNTCQTSCPPCCCTVPI